MRATVDCPVLSDYQRLVRGELPPAEIERISGHLEGCERCAATVHTLCDDETGLDAVRLARGDTPTLKGELPAGLFQRLCALKPPTSHTGTTTESATLSEQPATGGYAFLAPGQKPDEIGRLGPYRVLRVLGTGGMGVVFEAEDTQLRRKVALKVMKPAVAERPSARQRFLREARAAAAIEHDHIVPIYQVGEDRGVPYLAMQLLAGTSLDALLRKAGQLKPAQVLRIGRQIAEGLAAAHERGLVHRDIKPGNVWIESAQGGRVKILDFGLARPQSPDPQSPYREGGDESRDEPAPTETGAVLGTPSYMAPEQARGEKIDSRADLFSLGCVLYELATGKRPFTGADPLAVLTSLALDTPRPPSEFGVPAGLSDLIVRLLEKNPADRPGSDRALADRLQAIERQPATPAVALPSPTEEMPAAHPHAPPTPWGRGAGGKGWKRRALLAAAVVLAALVPLGYFFGGTVVRLATNQGQIVIETDDPNIEVLIKDRAGTITDRGSKREYTVKAGTEHEVEVTVKDERGEVQKFATRKFTVSRGSKEVLRVELELANAAKPEIKKPENPKPGQTPALAAGDERQAAEWVLSIGGAVGLPVGDNRQHITAAKDLPAQAFRLEGVDLTNQQVSDADLEHLKGLTNLTNLSLSRTQVSDAGLVHLKGLTNLNQLVLSGTRVSDAGLVHLKGLINLADLGLSGNKRVSDAGLEHLKGLTKLTILGLSYTRVSDAGLVHLKGLTKLTRLGLADTQVSDAGLEHLKGFTNLTQLHLNNTQVSDAGLMHLKGLSKLTELYLGGTRVSDAGLEHLKGLINLTTLTVAATQVSDAGLVHLKGLTNLMQLDLRNTRVSDAGLARLKALTKLTYLDLYGTKVSDAGLEHLTALTNLTALGLASTQVSDAGLERLKGLTNLTDLNLNWTRVSDAGLAHLKGLTRLTRLQLAYTRVSDAGLEHLEGLTKLTGLDLQGTRVSDTSLEWLANLKLSQLGLTTTRISAKGIADLKAALPGAQISWSEPNHTAAEAVLALGGTVHVRVKGGLDERPVKAVAELPAAYFQVTRATLADVKKPLGDAPAKLAALTDPDFDRLEVLDLSGAAIGDAYVATLQPISSLTELVLARTQVTDGGLIQLNGRKNLRRLVIDGTPIGNAGLSGLKELPALEDLSLARTQVGDAGLEPLKIQKKLRRLVLDGCPVRGTGLSHLKETNLTELRLGCPTLTDLFVKNVGELTKLERLSLAGSSLTDDGLKPLSGLTNLKELDLTGLKVTAAGVAALQKALPQCKVLSGPAQKEAPGPR